MNKFKQIVIATIMLLVIFSGSVSAQTGTDPKLDNNVYIPFFLSAEPDPWQEGLSPGVNWGLAANYPNDVGIENHPSVLAAEDFETGTVTIPTRENMYRDLTKVVSSHAYTGTYAGEHDWVEGEDGPTTRFVVPDSANQGPNPTYFMRMCMNFDDSFHPQDQDKGVGVKGFGIVSDPYGDWYAHPDGTNWYNAQIQFVGWGHSVKPEANDGFLWIGHMYSFNAYPAEAVAEVGDIEVSNTERFSAYGHPDFYIDFGGWHCYEIGLYLNTPGQFDGEARFWVDGVLQSRVTNMRYRDVENLYPTDMHLNLHRTSFNFEHTMVRWTDNIVLSTRYIGPVKTQ